MTIYKLLDPEFTYDSAIVALKSSIEDLKQTEKVYIESQEITADQLEEVYPEIRFEMRQAEQILNALNNVENRKWFIDSCTQKVESEIEKDDLIKLQKALESVERAEAKLSSQSNTLEKFENILEENLEVLLEFVSPTTSENRSLN